MTGTSSPVDGDRTVHGLSMSGYEIVRYDRAGKWYLERDDDRQRVTVQHAARVAAAAVFYPRLPGGQTFDRLVRDYRGAIATEVKS